jgi:hypothetical protein
MDLQRLVLCKFAIAHTAHEAFEAHVREDMPLQIALGGEFGIAFVAHKGFFPRMSP